jgi:5-oxoprolinase (ATP-hydrolysing)
MTEEWEFWIDTGGTFTDCLGRSPQGTFHRAKVLSSGSLRTNIQQIGTRSLTLSLPKVYPPNFFKGFHARFIGTDDANLVIAYDADHRKLELKEDLPDGVIVGDLVVLKFDGEAPELGARVITGTPGDEPLPTSRLRLATTKGTNALLEGKGARTVFFINKGLGDLLRIRTQQRPDLFALDIKRPEPIYHSVVEVEIDLSSGLPNTDEIVEQIQVLLDLGISTAALCLMNS